MSLQELTNQLLWLKSVFYDAWIDHVALFWSYARWDANQWSDVDLLYTRSKDAWRFLTLEKYMKLKRKIKKTLWMRIDLIPEQWLQKSFAQEIKKEKIAIF
jgi:uncharacterized protein